MQHRRRLFALAAGIAVLATAFIAGCGKKDDDASGGPAPEGNPPAAVASPTSPDASGKTTGPPVAGSPASKGPAAAPPGPKAK